MMQSRSSGGVGSGGKSSNALFPTSPEKLKKARMLSFASEALHVARPFVFADLMCRRALSHGEDAARASWLPLLLALLADAGSAALRAWAESEAAAAL